MDVHNLCNSTIYATCKYSPIPYGNRDRSAYLTDHRRACDLRYTLDALLLPLVEDSSDWLPDDNELRHILLLVFLIRSASGRWCRWWSQAAGLARSVSIRIGCSRCQAVSEIGPDRFRGNRNRFFLPAIMLPLVQRLFIFRQRNNIP